MSARGYSIYGYAGLVLLALIVAFLFAGGCSEDSPVADDPGGGNNPPPPPPPPPTLPDSALVTVQLVSWDDLSGHGAVDTTPAEVDEVRFEISAPDIQTITRTVPAGADLIEENFWIDTGAARRIEVFAYNAADSLIYGGAKFTDLLDSVVTEAVGLVSTSDDTPPVFTGLEDADAIGDNYVYLTWQPATDGSDADHDAIYLIYMSEVSGSFDYSTPSYVTEAGATSYLIADLAPSTTYYFVVRAMDRAGNVDLNTSQQSFTTAASGGALYVDVNSGSNNPACGGAGSPCRTITYALNKSAGNQTIHVAKGTYNAAAGEDFPLQLKPGTSLEGEGYWWMGVKVIKETYIEGTAPVIMGATGAAVISCYITPTAWGSSLYAILDDDVPIYVFHCTVDGARYNGCRGVGFGAASTLRGSRIENCTPGAAVSVWGAGGAVIKENTIVNNQSGIAVTTSNCDISHNVIEDNTSVGVNIWTDTGVVTDNVIFHNHIANCGGNGIQVTRVDGLEIIRNSISYSGGYGISIGPQESAYMVDVVANSIVHGSSAALLMRSGGANMWDNTFVCNVAGVYVRSDQVVDLRWNSWDHDPPTINWGRAGDEWCDDFYDICYEAIYAGTPEPLYQPDSGLGSCRVGILPVPPQRLPK